jgi:hypothetical protein
VTDPLEKFYVIISAISEANVDRVKHVVEAEPDEHSYDNLKEGLLASHVMTDYQKIYKLIQLEPLNGRKPSDMIIEMEKLKRTTNSTSRICFYKDCRAKSGFCCQRSRLKTCASWQRRRTLTWLSISPRAMTSPPQSPPPPRVQRRERGRRQRRREEGQPVQVQEEAEAAASARYQTASKPYASSPGPPQWWRCRLFWGC